jgi:RNase H-like domain found in reverse transcriptase/Integrase zinc binding domain/Reverse transcriptase (RNA-dependent DNA polymerase)
MPYGLYKPKVMFFGLQNSPATFQHFMDDSFADLVNKYLGQILIYMDDILLCSDNLTELHVITYEILDHATKLSLFFKPSKCHFEKNRIQYLGIEVHDGKILINLTKWNGLASWPTILKNVADVWSTLGILGYQQPFIYGFADIAQPITTLLKKGTVFHWTDKCTNALKILLKWVQEDPVLHRPDYTWPFELEVDASQYATGAILLQQDEDNKPHAVGYDSHTFNQAERNYPVYDQELLALVWGLLHWEHVLQSSPFPIKVYTDYNNLCYYQSPRHIVRCIARYMSKLAEFNFDLIHKPGTANRTNALSQHPGIDKGDTDNDDVTILLDKLFVHAIELSSFESHVWDAQLENCTLMKQWGGEYQIEEDANTHWWKADAPVVPENDQLRRDILWRYHDHPLAGHPGISNTLYAIHQNFWWPNLKTHITQYVKGCATCQMCNSLIGSFWLSICLWMIGSADVLRNPQFLANTSC